MISRRKSYSAMDTEQLRAATREFDREFVRETFGPPTPRAKVSLAQAQLKRRKTSQMGPAKVSIRVERALLKQADEFAKQHQMSRSQLVSAGLKRMLGAPENGQHRKRAGGSFVQV
jgi:hypothetical protein